MRIGYLAQLSPEVRFPPFDGPANHIRQVISKLQDMGNKVTFLGGFGDRIVKCEDIEGFSDSQTLLQKPDMVERGVRRIQGFLRFPYINYFISRRFAIACQKELYECDVLLERASWMGYGGALAARSMNIPLVLEYNGDPLHDLAAKRMDPRGIQRAVSKNIFRQTLTAASHIIASGNGWRSNLINEWQIKPHRISVVENGTPLVDLLRREQLRNFQDNPDPTPVSVVYLGGFYAWHGTLLAVKALNNVLTRGFNARMVMIGAGEQYDETRSLARALDIADRVTFTGPLQPDEFAPILADADIALSPYCGWKEYSGLKLFDYKAAGLAIIASGEKGQPETISHGHSGWIVPPCDLDSLTAAMHMIIENRDLRRKLGQNARIEAEKWHSWERTASEIERILTELVTGSKNPKYVPVTDAVND